MANVKYEFMYHNDLKICFLRISSFVSSVGREYGC